MDKKCKLVQKVMNKKCKFVQKVTDKKCKLVQKVMDKKCKFGYNNIKNVENTVLLSYSFKEEFIMGLFGDKDTIANAALGASGAFDQDKNTDVGKAFGMAMGMSIASGKTWTLEDSISD